jgi:hypothetical protein
MTVAKLNGIAAAAIAAVNGVVPAAVNGVAWPAGGATDPDFANVILLLHCDGADEGTTFTDSSPLAQTVTPVNTVTDSGSAKWGTAGARFDTSGGAGRIGCSDTNAFKPLHDGSNWTVEGWFALGNYTANNGLFGNNDTSGATGIFCFLNSSRQVRLAVTYSSPGNYIVDATSGAIWPNDSAYHFLRVSCDFGLGSNNYKVFIDDMTTPAAQFSKTGNTPSSGNPSNAFVIGDVKAGGGVFIQSGAKCDDFRVTANVVRTSAIPTEAFPDS